MMELNELREHLEITGTIDWDMTPEDAVTQYLEWGNASAHGYRNVVRSKSDVSTYFLINAWDDSPKIYLVRRNSDDAVDLAAIDIPDRFKDHFMETDGQVKGIYPLNDEIRAWLQQELYES
ncbi:MAG: hypothetical protein LWX55_11530 [Deltaproteobacteria bacterium]|jgi:hypothetical protein|nr:hypothetical protein [Deltaproteobacteria bacterium]